MKGIAGEGEKERTSSWRRERKRKKESGRGNLALDVA